MKKLQIKDKNGDLKIEDKKPLGVDTNEWLEAMRIENNWIKEERLKVKSEALEEEIASAIETIPAVMEGEVEVSPEMIKLPKTYEIIIEDISSEILAEKNKEYEKKALKLALKDIKDADLSTVAELRKAFKDLLKVLL